jgi:hypothetical protein
MPVSSATSAPVAGRRPAAFLIGVSGILGFTVIVTLGRHRLRSPTHWTPLGNDQLERGN